MKQYIVIGAILLVAVAMAQSYRMGYKNASFRFEAKIAEAQREAFENAELASRKEEERLMAESEYRDRVATLEEQANADSGAGNICIGPDGVRRLNLR